MQKVSKTSLNGSDKMTELKLGCITSELKVITCFSGVTYILNIYINESVSMTPAIYYYFFFGFSQPLYTHKSSGITALILHVQEVFYQEGCVVTFYISTCHYGEMKKCDKYATQI